MGRSTGAVRRLAPVMYNGGNAITFKEQTMINADKPHLWKPDIAASVDLFNDWFIRFAPQTYRETRAKTTSDVEEALQRLDDMRGLNPETVKAYPAVLQVLRMSTA